MRSKLLSLFFAGLLCAAAPGCARPNAPSLTGPGLFHDITQIKKGMTNSDVQRIMGSHYTLVAEEGLQGMDMGVYAWDYPEGRIYFSIDGVTRVVPTK
jgi:hypothetical protein